MIRFEIRVKVCQRLRDTTIERHVEVNLFFEQSTDGSVRVVGQSDLVRSCKFVRSNASSEAPAEEPFSKK